MTLPDDWWTTGLEDEPCDGCGVKPSKHEGHGSFTCERCFNARWCLKCGYSLRPEPHVCVAPEIAVKAREKHDLWMRYLNDIWLAVADVMKLREEIRSARADAIAECVAVGEEMLEDMPVAVYPIDMRERVAQIARTNSRAVIREMLRRLRDKQK